MDTNARFCYVHPDVDQDPDKPIKYVYTFSDEVIIDVQFPPCTFRFLTKDILLGSGNILYIRPSTKTFSYLTKDTPIPKEILTQLLLYGFNASMGLHDNGQ